jgi:hypothetical protein
MAGGIGHVAAYLAALDLAPFDAKAPPPKTAAFWAIVDAHRAPEDAELADVLDSIGTKTPEGGDRMARRGDDTRHHQRGEHGGRRVPDVDTGPQEPPRDPASHGTVRLCPGPPPQQKGGQLDRRSDTRRGLRKEQLVGQ